MDPEACARRIREHLEAGELPEAYHALCDIRAWNRRGGERKNVTTLRDEVYEREFTRSLLDEVARRLGWLE